MTPQEQKAFFEKQGYLIVEDFLSPEEVQERQEEIKCLHEVAAELEAKGGRLSYRTD